MSEKVLKYLTGASIILMIIVNLLSNVIPFNGVNTAQVSDTYKVFFVPAGYVFSIWGLIYVLLIIFAISQLKVGGLRKIQIPIIISSIANCIWLLLWHYFQIGLSVLVMLILLALLIYIYENLKGQKAVLKMPFSVYLGWISVATIANITAYLYSINWSGFGISGSLWTAILIVIAGVLGCIAILRNRDYAYPLVIVWAIVGILVKFPGQRDILIGVIIAMVFIAVAILFVMKERFGLSQMNKKDSMLV
jgi:hypothetical protein